MELTGTSNLIPSFHVCPCRRNVWVLWAFHGAPMLKQPSKKFDSRWQGALALTSVLSVAWLAWYQLMVTLTARVTLTDCQSIIVLFSSRGNGLGLLGPSGLPLAIWLSERLACQEEIWIGQPRQNHFFFTSDRTRTTDWIVYLNFRCVTTMICYA